VIIALLLTGTVVWINRLPAHLVGADANHTLHNPLIATAKASETEDNDSDDPYTPGENEVFVEDSTVLHSL
jgi:hypothetical protein